MSRSVFQAGLTNGGPSGLVYGYIFTWLGNISQVLVMAELASMSALEASSRRLVADRSLQDPFVGWTIQLVSDCLESPCGKSLWHFIS